MKKHLAILALLSTGLTLSIPHAFAQGEEKPAATKKAAKPAKKAAKKPAEPKAAAKPGYDNTESDEDGKDPDVTGSLRTEYQCDLGATVSIYQNQGDPKHVALRWEKTLHRLRRVETTTGADRFENRKSGLIWIGIPAKSILLDAKKGQQLANECKSPDQMAGKLAVPTAPVAPAAAPAATSAPAVAPAAEPPKDAAKSGSSS